MELFEAISKRASVREYKPEPVDKALLEKLVDAARRAPTARAVEPWEFIVVQKKDTLTKLAALAAKNAPFLKKAAAALVVYCKDTKYYLEDGVAATENILIACASGGLGACWVAGDKKPYAADMSKLLGVPAELKLISVVSIGYPAREPKQVKNRKLEDVIHWEKF